MNAQTASEEEDGRGDARWGRLPSWWLEHPEVDADGLAVLAALATFANRHGRCWPSQATLAAKLKRSRAWVNKTLGRLADAGLVASRDRWSENGGRLSCLYELKTAQDRPVAAPASGRDAPVDTADAPCQPRRLEQPEPEHTPDSHASPAGGRKAIRSTEIPVADWSPTEEDRRWAETRHADVDVDRHAEGFRLRCQAHGYRYRDVSAAWRAWLDQDVAAGKAPSAGKSSHVGSRPQRRPAAIDRVPAGRVEQAERTLDAWRAVAARLTAAPSPV